MNPPRSHNWLRSAMMTTALSATLLSSFALELKSPDGLVVINFELQSIGAVKGCPVYRLSFQGRPVLGDSQLGFELRGGALAGDFQITGSQTTTSDTTWQPVNGESANVRDHYHQLVVDLEEVRSPQRRLQLTFRAYNEGAAFCYTLPAQTELTKFVITRDLTQFAFTGDHTAWAVYSAQGNYDPGDPRRQSKSAKQGAGGVERTQAGSGTPVDGARGQ